MTGNRCGCDHPVLSWIAVRDWSRGLERWRLTLNSEGHSNVDSPAAPMYMFSFVNKIIFGYYISVITDRDVTLVFVGAGVCRLTQIVCECRDAGCGSRLLNTAVSCMRCYHVVGNTLYMFVVDDVGPSRIVIAPGTRSDCE